MNQRTYQHAYKDYLKWLYETTGKYEYLYENFFSGLSSEDKKIVEARLYREILELCYDKDYGLYYFIKFIIGDMRHVGFPHPYRYNSLLRKWDLNVKNNKRLVIQCSRGFGKTMFFTEILNIYDMFLFSYRRILIISASQDQANRILTEIKTIIESNEILNTKSSSSKWAAESIGYNQGYILAKGLTSEIRGQHVDRIVLDDILRGDNKVSMSYIEDFVYATLSPMLVNRRGQFIIVGTPMNEQDIFFVLQKRIEEEEDSVWAMYKYPAIIDLENKIVQCADRFTFDMLMEEKSAIGSLKFNREYQLEIYSKEASLFPFEILKPALDMGKDYSILFKSENNNMSYIIGVDVARSGSASADFSVATVIEYDANTNTKRLAYLWRKKGVKIIEQAREIAQISRKFNNAIVVVETNNMGQDMIDALVDDFNVHVESYTTGNKKIELIRFLISSFEHEQFIIPQADYDSIQMFQPLLEELERFSETVTPAGNIKYEGVGGKDDCVMSLAIANKGTQEFSSPIIVMDFDRNGGGIYDASSFNTKESDLVYKIKHGLI